MGKILFFAGSARADSFNKKLAKAAFSYAQTRDVEATFVDLRDYPMPLYDGDWENDHGLPDKALAFKAMLMDHDGFFVASPEYNGLFSPLLKNTLDWATRPHEDNERPLVAFKGKVAAVCSASPGGLGGLRGLPHVRTLLGNIGVTVIPDQLAVGGAFKAFDDEGALSDDQQRATLESIVDRLIVVTKALKGNT